MCMCFGLKQKTCSKSALTGEARLNVAVVFIAAANTAK